MSEGRKLNHWNDTVKKEGELNKGKIAKYESWKPVFDFEHRSGLWDYIVRKYETREKVRLI